MTVNTLYTYLGTNGTLTTKIFLPNTPNVVKKELISDNGYLLTKDGKSFTNSVIVPEHELEEWQEVKA